MRAPVIPSTVLAVAMLVGSLAWSREIPVKTVDLAEKSDDIFFPGRGLVVSCHISGFSTKTAKLEALTAPSGTPAWSSEIEIGRADHVLPRYTWNDPSGNVMFVGNGPISAVDVATGKVAWSVPYDQVGMVYGIRPLGGRLLVYGTQKISGVKFKISTSGSIPQPIEDHLKDPVLLCVDGASGSVRWSYKYEPPSRGGAANVLDGPVDSTLLIQGKQLRCVGVEDGREWWVYPDELAGDLVLLGGRVYARAGDSFLCLDGRTGKELWTVGKKSKLGRLLSKALRATRFTLTGVSGGAVVENRTFTVAGNALYASVKKRFQAYDVGDGHELWRSSKETGEDAIIVGMVDSDHFLTLSCGDYQEDKAVFEGQYLVSCIEASTGKVVWNFDKGEDLRRWGFGASGRVVLVDKRKYYELDGATGEITSEAKAENSYLSVASAEDIYVWDKDGVRCYRHGGRELAWQVEADLARKSKGLILSILQGLSDVTTALSGSFSVSGKTHAPMPSHLVLPMSNDRKLADACMTDSEIIFPTRDRGIWGISKADGSILWTADVKEDPFPCYPEPMEFIVVPQDRQLRIVELAKAGGGR